MSPGHGCNIEYCASSEKQLSTRQVVRFRMASKKSLVAGHSHAQGNEISTRWYIYGPQLPRSSSRLPPDWSIPWSSPVGAYYSADLQLAQVLTGCTACYSCSFGSYLSQGRSKITDIRGPGSLDHILLFALALLLFLLTVPADGH